MHNPFKILLGALILVLLTSTWFGAARSQEPPPDAKDASFLERRIRDPDFFPRRAAAWQELAAASARVPSWLVETVDGAEEVGYFNSIAIDQHGWPHIAYSQSGDLKYAYYDGSAWQVETVDDSDRFGHISLALDHADLPHISYCYFDPPTCDGLKYAHGDGSAWVIENVSIAANTGEDSSLAVDSAGSPHISFSGNGHLKYAYHDGSAWQIEIVDQDDDDWSGDASSLALDAADRPHISYHCRYDSMKLCYARHDGLAWQIEIVSSVAWGEFVKTSLALDAANHPHIAYSGFKSVRYAHHNGSIWKTETVDNVDSEGTTSLALDSAGRPHIAYAAYDSYRGRYDLKYTYRDGGGWQIQKVLDDKTLRVSLAIDERGQPHIAYYVCSGADLGYAALLPDLGDWSKLAFASYRDMNWEIYTAHGNGTNPTRRTYLSVTDSTPEFNRGATQLVFVSTRDDGDAEIYTMSADGSHQTRLTWTNGGEFMPTWSPDGSQIAFYSDRDGNNEIYVMNADGSQQTRLTFDPAWDGHPTWSPDGAQIAFISERSGQDELWTMNADGSQQQQLSSGLGYAVYPDWSPDGRRIAFSYDANRDSWLELAVINADGTGLDRPLGYSPYFYDSLGPTWAPNGQTLAFAVLHWIYYQGNWYWTDSYLHYLPTPRSKYAYLLTSSGLDLWPDWQTSDLDAPDSQVAALPAWSSADAFSVRWTGADNSLAGVHSYDVQYRDGPFGEWIDWLVGTIHTTATFDGERGHTYYFRCRARDHAGNLEAYPDGDGDAFIHVYRYTLPGRILDNRDQPVSAAAVQAAPPALNTALSGAGGAFALYFDQAGLYDLEAWRDEFGYLPPMLGVPVTETSPSPILYLPPADDHVASGSFETGSLDAWRLTGDVAPTLATTAHTGAYAAALGGLVADPVVMPTAPFEASDVFTRAGGALENSSVRVQVPPGTVIGTAVFTLTGVPTVAQLPTDAQDVGLHFALTATLPAQTLAGTLLLSDSQPLTLTVAYQEAAWQAAQVSGEQSLALWRYEQATDAWQPLAGTLDTLSNTLTVTTGRLGSFALLGTPARSWHSILEQQVVLSPTLTSGTVSLLYQAASVEPASDSLQLWLVGPTQTLTHTLPLTTSGWTHYWCKLPVWPDPGLTLRVLWAQGQREHSVGVIVDEISLGSAIEGSYAIYLPLATQY